MGLVGVDLGGSKTAIGVVADDAVRDRLVIESRGEEGPEAWVARVTAAVTALRGDTEIEISAIGIGVAGQVDGRGRLALAPNLGWSDVDMAGMIGERTGLPVRVLGDVQAIAMGEWLYGAARGVPDVAAVFLGTGVGSGIILDGALRRGAGGSLGEIGHLKVSLDGPPCTCGDRGCLEAVVGGWALEARAVERIRAGEPSTLTAASAGPAAIAAAARTGDELAMAVLDTAGRALGAGIASLLHAYNPAVVVFGGGLVVGIPELVTRGLEEARNRSLPAPLGDVRFAEGTLGVDAGILGAAGWAEQTAVHAEEHADGAPVNSFDPSDPPHVPSRPPSPAGRPAAGDGDR